MPGQMSYQVGVDLGTACSAAAVCQPGRTAPPRIVPLAPDGAFMPSVAFLNPDGTLLVGADALNRMPPDPGRLVRQFKRRIGDETPLRIGGTAMMASDVAARFVAGLLDVVVARVGGRPSRVALTHPAGWGPHRLTTLRAALAAHGAGDVLFLPEPQAAALAFAASERLEPGSAIAVYDLGAGSFDAAVVRMIGPDRFVLLGRPESIELGLLDFDEAVFEHVRSALGQAWDSLDPADPAVLAAVTRLRCDCITAKEALSADTDVSIPVVLPGIDTRVRLTRPEFEDMIRPAVAETVDVLERAIGSAGLAAGELAAVLMVGGSARIPLVTQEVSARLGRPVSTPADPKGILAAGAALAASGREAEPAPGGLWPALPTAPVAAIPFPADQPAGPPPPPPVVPPPPMGGTGSPRRRLALTVAAAALAAVVIGGGAALASRISPSGAGADPTTVVTTTDPGVSSGGEPDGPPVTPAAGPQRTSAAVPARPQQQINPPPARRTPSTTTTPTTTSTSPPAQVSTSGPSSTGSTTTSTSTTPASANEAGPSGSATTSAGA
jgi:molecular chaperone DnaK